MLPMPMQNPNTNLLFVAVVEESNEEEEEEENDGEVAPYVVGK